jgi:hypothetical protein
MGAIAEAAAALQDAKRRVDRRAYLGRQEQRLHHELDGAREELARLADVVRTEGNDVARLDGVVGLLVDLQAEALERDLLSRAERS